MNLFAAGLPWIEDLFNRYLALDPEFPSRLQGLENTVLKVEISGIELDIYATIQQDRIGLSETSLSMPNITLCGTPLALLSFLHADDAMSSMQTGVVELSGDVQLARKVQTAFASLDIDWEEIGASLIGDWPAHQIHRIGNEFRDWGRHAHESFSRSLGEYLQEEARLLPSRIEIENFMAEVDWVREAVDRLEARFNQTRAERKI